MAYITLVATAVAMSGDKTKTIFPSLLANLGGEGEYDPDKWVKTATDAQLTVMFGSRYKGREGGQ